MKKQTLLILLLSLLLFSCNEEAVFNCNDCLTSRPVDGELTIKISTVREGVEGMTIQVYQGKTETGILLHEESLEFWLRESFTFEVPLNQYYSVRCVYHTDEGDYAVIDGTFLKAKRVEYLECETECWTIQGGKLRAKL